MRIRLIVCAQGKPTAGILSLKEKTQLKSDNALVTNELKVAMGSSVVVFF